MRGQKVTERSKSLKRELIIVVLALLALSLFASTQSLIPLAKANEVYLDLSPTSGPPGSTVSAYGVGYVSGSVTVAFNSKDISRTTTGMFSRINTGFIVPSVAPGIYDVTATDSAGNRATARFTVTQKGSSSSGSTYYPSTSTASAVSVPPTTATVSLSATRGPAGTAITATGQSFTPGVVVTVNFGATYVGGAVTDNSGTVNCAFSIPAVPEGIYSVSASDARGKFATTTFTVTAPGTAVQYSAGTSSIWSIVAIVMVGLAIFCVILLGFMFIRGRGSKEEKMLTESKPDLLQPKPNAPSTKPYAPSKYDRLQNDRFLTQKHNLSGTSYRQPSSYSSVTRRPVASNPYNQPRRYSQPATAVKTCPHCRQPVRADYSTCPFCRKRL